MENTVFLSLSLFLFLFRNYDQLKNNTKDSRSKRKPDVEPSRSKKKLANEREPLLIYRANTLIANLSWPS